MPASELTVQKITKTGVTPTYGAANTDGNFFANDGRTFLIVKNGGAGSINITIDSANPCNYGFDHDVVVAVGAGSEEWIGPFEKGRFNNDQRQTSVSYSAVANVTVAAIRA